MLFIKTSEMFLSFLDTLYNPFWFRETPSCKSMIVSLCEIKRQIKKSGDCTKLNYTLTSFTRVIVMAIKLNSQDSLIPVAEAEDHARSIPYECCYIGVLILDLILGLVVIFILGDILYSEDDKLPLLFLIIPLSIFGLFQFFGWKGYLHHDVKSAKIFATYRLVMAIILIFGAKNSKIDTQDLDKDLVPYFACSLGAFALLVIAMAFVSRKYVRNLKCSL